MSFILYCNNCKKVQDDYSSRCTKCTGTEIVKAEVDTRYQDMIRYKSDQDIKKYIKNKR